MNDKKSAAKKKRSYSMQRRRLYKTRPVQKWIKKNHWDPPKQRATPNGGRKKKKKKKKKYTKTSQLPPNGLITRKA
jgi:hypothetical protein